MDFYEVGTIIPTYLVYENFLKLKSSTSVISGCRDLFAAWP